MRRSSRIALILALALMCATASSRASGTFSPTGSMTAARHAHTATLLADGRVLIAGGDGWGSLPAGSGAELYDPVNGTFAATGSMIRSRGNHSATRLADGQVLIVGGWDEASAELYDPSTGTFSLIGEVPALQNWNTATLLANGKVLIAGDAGAQLYDPAAAQFLLAGTYAKQLYYINTATLLADGRVLLVGDDPAQLYDPATNTFSLTGSLGATTHIYGLELHSATLLGNGQVLIAGGMNDEVSPAGRVAAAELYDAATGVFSPTSAMQSPRDGHAAVLLPGGKVLIVGGETGSCIGGTCQYAGSLSSAELYDPASGTFSTAGAMSTPRGWPRATLLDNGDVLITGGGRASAEIYRPERPGCPSPR